MRNEAPGWGNLTPLTRVTATEAAANRAKICEDGTYQPLYIGDSCEEYPFASTAESGGNNGLTGADCAMVRATETNGQRYIQKLTNVTGAEGCVIGHADTTSQNSQGGTMSSFYQNYRVAPGDKYWVSITA
jgi:hypothetical protein